MLLAETPAIDPKSIIGRVTEISVPEITGDQSKYYMKLYFRVNKVDGENAYTKFYGYKCVREYTLRMVRKRAQKIKVVNEMETKDKWKLQTTTLAILNRKTDITIEKKVRDFIFKFLANKAKLLSNDEFVHNVINNNIQKEIKKLGSKIYPVRFCEIERIEVIKAP